MYASMMRFTIVPEAAVAGGTGQVKVYNGSTWDTCPVKVYNGSTWDTCPVKVYNGSTWEESTA